MKYPLQAFLKRKWDYLIIISKKVSLPGFEKRSIYEVGDFFIKSVTQEGIKLRSSSMAFSFFLAIFPSLLFVLTLISYLPINGLHYETLTILESLLPDEAYITIRDTVTDILTNQNAGILSLGGFMFIYFASNGIISMIDAFNIRYQNTKSFIFKDRLKAIGITLFISVQAIGGISLFIFYEYIINSFKSNIFGFDYNYYLLIFSKFVFLFLLMTATISALYHFCTNFKTKYKLISPGSMLATFLCLLTTYLFSYYINNFSSYNQIYGSLGTIIGLMMLIYINCMSILIGYELNASILDANRAWNKNNPL